MPSAHLSSAVIPQDHRLSMPTEMQGIEESLPRSFTILPDSGLRREPLKTELLSEDQYLSETLSMPVSPRHTSLLASNETTGMVIQRLEMPLTTGVRNGASNSTSASQIGQRSDSDRAFTSCVLCDICDEWITTKDADGNDNGNWTKHTATCTYSRATRDGSPSVPGDASASMSGTPAPTADSNEPRDTNTAFRRRKVKHYESERLSLLQRDPQADEVEEYRVLCGFCEKWIQLRKDRRYCPISWTAHKLQCVNRRRKSGPIAKKLKREHLLASGVPYDVPTPTVQVRRTEEERLRFLESDPHATTVEPHRILCGICHRWIQLRKNSTYCTAPWVQHVKKCAIKHDIPRPANDVFPAYQPLDEDGEDEAGSDDGAPRNRADSTLSPTKRGRGRPRKHKLTEPTRNGQASFALRPAHGRSPSPTNRREGHRSSPSPHPMRTPSPPLDHPYAHDMYWYPALPPMSSYYPLYAGSQYNESDDSYSLYFHAQPPPHQPGPTSGQGRFRAKLPKHSSPNAGGTHGPGSWQGGHSSNPGPSGSSPFSGLEGASSLPSRTWIVWRLRDYSTNPCPMDRAPAPAPHTSAASEAGSGSGSEPLPMFRSGTWPHLLDPEDPTRQQSLSPYVHPDLGTENGSASSTRPGPFSQLSPPPPPQPKVEDPALVAFNSSDHISIRRNESRVPPSPVTREPNVDSSFSAQPPLPPPNAAVPPSAPTGPDLDSPECRLVFTFQAIAYLFSTSFQGADDMSLETLLAFMNRTIPHDKRYDGQELSQHVAILGERGRLVFTREGGVQLLRSPPP